MNKNRPNYFQKKNANIACWLTNIYCKQEIFKHFYNDYTVSKSHFERKFNRCNNTIYNHLLHIHLLWLKIFWTCIKQINI